jgi:CO/xanthine dehydrogenase Mo-binding subunit
MERRDFLKRTGLTLGFLVAPGGLLRVVDAHACGEEGDVDLNAWVHISNSENTITVKCPTAEMGQGNYTAIPLLVAEELDADWRTIRVEQAPAEKAYANPDDGTAGGCAGARDSDPQRGTRMGRFTRRMQHGAQQCGSCRCWPQNELHGGGEAR